MQVIHNDNKRVSGQKRGRETSYEKPVKEHHHNEFDDSPKKSVKEHHYNEFDDSDDEGEIRNTQKRRLNPKTSQYHTAISDSSNSESTKTPPPPPRSKPSKAKGPDTPAPPTDKPVKYSESTPDSTPLSKQRDEPADEAVTGQEGVKRCLFDLVETEGKKYIRKLRKAARLSESEINSAEELAKSGATLSEHGETIQKLGKRLISISKERFDEYVKSLTQASSTIHNE